MIEITRHDFVVKMAGPTEKCERVEERADRLVDFLDRDALLSAIDIYHALPIDIADEYTVAIVVAAYLAAAKPGGAT